MITEIKGKPIKGYQFADGVHWHWGNEEVAVIDESTNEIEWTVHKHNLPTEVVEEIRKRRKYHSAEWIIRVNKLSQSATQGEYQITINDTEIIRFAAKKELGKDGEYHFDIPDNELGRLVLSLLYHPMDNLYHYSDKVREVFGKGCSNE